MQHVLCMVWYKHKPTIICLHGAIKEPLWDGIVVSLNPTIAYIHADVTESFWDGIVVNWNPTIACLHDAVKEP